ncbi:MAG: hypothetical protein ACF8MJ_06660 [Phycisphaerales bacterium JB050]
MSQSASKSSTPKPTGNAPRQWLGVMFRCCNQYGRIYKNDAGTQYIGRCPRCANQVTAKVGEGGTDQRFFETR